MDLRERKCEPCEKGGPALPADERDRLLTQVPTWGLVSEDRALAREFSFPTYKDGLAFAARVGTMADAEGHHPDLFIGYKRVRVLWTTHAVGGLSVNDFIAAAKTDSLIDPGHAGLPGPQD